MASTLAVKSPYAAETAKPCGSDGETTAGTELLEIEPFFFELGQVVQDGVYGRRIGL